MDIKPKHHLSLTHAHFLIMGGFIVRVENDSDPDCRRVLIGQDLDEELIDSSNKESSDTSSHESSLNETSHSVRIRDLICEIDAENLQD